MTQLFYLFGYPGVGKNTIARAMERLSSGAVAQGKAQSDMIAVQNHLISNAFRHAMSKQDRADYARLEPIVKHHTMKAWLNFLDFVAAALPEQGLIFTSVLYDDPEKIEFYDYVRDWAVSQNRRFIPVRLNCARDELIDRLTAPERDAAFKLTDVATLDNIIASNDLLTPDDANFIDLDVTKLSAEAAAQAILGYQASDHKN